MFLLELFATMSARRRSIRRHNEEGAEITRRLRELLDSTKPKQDETSLTIAARGGSAQTKEHSGGKYGSGTVMP
jgi:hypothetical protein